MDMIIHVILSVSILFQNNAKSVSLKYSTEQSTMKNITTDFLNFDNDEYTTNDENISVIPPAFNDSQSIPLINDYWMSQMGVIKDDLMRIQAIIVKDKEAEEACIDGNQKSSNRYLMCAGSILNRNRVLTSASCLHEAMHMRHNVHAPLAVIIAPLKSTVQMIRVAEYRIHPKHHTNPYSPDYPRHNLAILSLACRISSKNYHKISLPNQAMTHICTEENCFIAIYRKIGYTSNVVYQILAPQIPLYNRKRRRSISDAVRKIDLNGMLIGSHDNHDKSKRINKRSSDGSNSCSQTGAPVMINSTQTAIVAVSCDDRQQSGQWAYTDLYKNLNWIHSILYDWNKTESHIMTGDYVNKSQSNITSSNSKACGNCIFNFYISVGCKLKGNCPKIGNNRSIKLSYPSSIGKKPLNVQNVNRDRVREKKIQSSWNRGQISNKIPRLLRSSFKLCPGNFSKCPLSLGEINDVQHISPFKPLYPSKLKNSVNKQFKDFAFNPISIKINESYSNDNTNYNIIYPENERFINLTQNDSRIFNKKPGKLLKIYQNMYVPINIGRNKHIQNDVGDWLKKQKAITGDIYRNM